MNFKLIILFTCEDMSFINQSSKILMFLKFNYSRQGTPHFPDSKSNIFSKSATIFIFYNMIFNVNNKNQNCTKERKSRFYNVITLRKFQSSFF